MNLPMASFLAIAIALVGGLAVETSAAERVFCVRCVEPVQNYVCAVEHPDAVRPAQSLQLYCIVNLARLGNHASCSAQRKAPEECQGIETTLTYTGPTITMAPNEADFGGEAVTQVAPETNDNSQPPRTLIEATDRIYESSKRQIKNAGQTVTDATKKVGRTVKKSAQNAGRTVTEGAEKAGGYVGRAAKSAYDCVTSLFSDCN